MLFCEGEGGDGDAYLRAEDGAESGVAGCEGGGGGADIVYQQDVMNLLW